MAKLDASNAESIDAEAIMETIRTRARASIGRAAPAASLEACRALAGYGPPPGPEIGSLPPAPPTWRGRVGACGVRIVRRALFWYTRQLQEARNEELAWRETAAHAIGELNAVVVTLQARLRQAERLNHQVGGQVGKNDVWRFERSAGDGDEWPEAVRVELERRNGHGTGKDGRSRRPYLPWVREAKAGSASRPVLDLGCGDGEWLALLRGEGLSAAGVDSNRFLVEHCRRLNLDVHHADLLDHLRGLPARSCGMVTAFHVCEHLGAGKLLAMIDEITRVLRSRGLVIIETLNPKNLFVATQAAVEDPTRRLLLDPDLAEFLLDNRGFELIKTMRLRKSPRKAKLPKNGSTNRFINEHFFGATDYSVIARKA